MLRPLSGTRRPRSRAFLGIVAAVLATNAFYLPIPVAHASFVGTGVGGFLGFEVGGRPAGMGGAQTGGARGLMSQYRDPAPLSTPHQPQGGAHDPQWARELQNVR